MDEFNLHKKGKLDIRSKIKISKETLPYIYTPKVANIVKSIAENPELVYEYTIKSRTVAIVNDGTRVLGLGKVGPESGLPVMEGKAAILSELAGINAFPISIKETKLEKMVEIIKAITPPFGAINLEDIETPKVFYLYDILTEEIDIPVFHDDRHGTGMAVLVALINALAKANIQKPRVVLIGAGAASRGIMELLLEYGIKDITVLDSKGVLDYNRKDIQEYKKWFIENSNPIGTNIDEALKGADVLIAASSPNILKREQILKMNYPRVVFTLSNPVPEIPYEEIKDIAIVGTARSDYPNQINNFLIFPGVFKGILEGRLKKLTLKDMVYASVCLSKLAKESLTPDPLDKKTVEVLATAISKKICKCG